MVEVTQEDREVAGLVCELTGWAAIGKLLRAGATFPSDYPEEQIVQTIARHRTTALAAKEAENAELRDMIATLGENAAKAAREYSELIAAERAKVEKLREALGRNTP